MSFFCAKLFFYPSRFFKNSPRFILIWALFTLYVGVLTYYSQGVKGFGVLADNHISTLLLVCVLWFFKNEISLGFIYVVRIVLVVAFYSIIEFMVSNNFLYSSLFSQTSWIATQWGSGFYRSASTIGHPLIAATIYLITLNTIKPKLNYRYLFTVLVLIMAIVSTGSRSALVLSLVSLPLRLLLEREFKKFTFIVLLFLVVMSLLYMLGFFDQLIVRFLNSDGSNLVRMALVDIAYLAVFDNIFIGRGLGSHGIYSDNIGFYNSIEMAWLALIIEIGFLGLLVYVYCWWLFIVQADLWKENKVMLLSLVVMLSGFNSISLHTPILVFLVIIMCLRSSSFGCGQNKCKSLKE